MMRAVLGPAIAVLTACAVMPDAAQAQQSYQQVVATELAGLATRSAEQGYRTRVGQTMTGSVAQGAIATVEINLQGGTSYVLFAACDQDCTDLDLRLFGPDGNMLAEDVALDDRPVLTVQVPATGTYRLAVMMATCRQNPCYWGAQVFSR